MFIPVLTTWVLQDPYFSRGKNMLIPVPTTWIPQDPYFLHSESHQKHSRLLHSSSIKLLGEEHFTCLKHLTNFIEKFQVVHEIFAYDPHGPVKVMVKVKVCHAQDYICMQKHCRKIKEKITSPQHSGTYKTCNTSIS